MIRVAVVEDELEEREKLEGYLKQYEKERQESFAVTCFADGDSIVHQYRAQFDLILMDIEMKLMDGMSAVEEIRKVDTEVVIIFITNMAQYAIRGYAVDAMDYVLKPISYFAFSERIGRAIGRMKQREKKTLSIEIRGGVARLDAADVYYVESQRHVILWHTASGIYESSGTMEEIGEELYLLNFRRGNKGYLINLAHVEGMRDGCALVKGEELVISRARRKEFMEELTEYWGEVMK